MEFLNFMSISATIETEEKEKELETYLSLFDKAFSELFSN